METLNKSIKEKKERPVKVLQFGEGNFLRAFVDEMIDKANEEGYFNGNIEIVKPRAHGSLSQFINQDFLYTVSLKGIVNGKAGIQNRIITSVSDVYSAYNAYDKFLKSAHNPELQFVVSNTTEAGIIFDEKDSFMMTPPESFPGKLTRFLYERYTHFNGAYDKGLIILPVELIDDNGYVLKDCVDKLSALWGLSDEFTNWVNKSCIFCSTLVDRIVSGYPKTEEEQNEIFKSLGYEDRLFVAGEPFALWIIEGPKEVKEKLPFEKAGLPVIFTDDLKPYKKRKVRILNGAHTSFVLASYLCGNDYVGQSMEDPLIYSFMEHTLYDEVMPTLDLPKEELNEFTEAVITRFKNPYVKHALLSIALNSVSKWRTRCLPTLLDYYESKKNLPGHLSFSLAALMAFYSSDKLKENCLVGQRNNDEYLISDDSAVLSFFSENSKKDTKTFVNLFLSREDFFGTDLTNLDGFSELVTNYLDDIRNHGMRKALETNFNE